MTMKWLSSLAVFVASTAVTVSAGPILPRADPLRVYKLKVVAPVASNLNGRYLSIDSSGNVGIFSTTGAGTAPSADAEVSARDPPVPAQFYAVASNTSGDGSSRVELHTYPVGIIDHALALTGAGGLLSLKDVANPAAAKSNGPEGGRIDWQSFTLGGANDTGSGPSGDTSDQGTDRQDSQRDASIDLERAPAKRAPPPLLSNGFSYAGSRGRWVVIQRGQNTFPVSWYDGVSPILDNYRPIDIAYEVTAS